MLTILDLNRNETLLSSDMGQVAGGSVLGDVIGALGAAISTVANAALDGAEAVKGISDPVPPLPGQHGGGLIPLNNTP